MSDSKKSPSAFMTFTTSGVGGIMGWMVVHPFNTLGVRMNLANAGRAATDPHPSFYTFSRQVVAKEGFMTLYAGLSAGITRQIFYATSRLGLYEVFRDAIEKQRPLDFASRLGCACVAGGLAAIVSCPAEVSLVRMSNDRSLPIEQRRNYTSVVNAATRIVREEGAAAFWRGSTPFTMRAVLVGGTQVATYDQFKVVYANLGVPKGISLQFCASMSAGLVYSLITMPFESTKNRMAFQRPDPQTGKLLYTGVFQTIRMIAAKEGVLALWEGFLPYYLRCGGHTVAMFIAVEQLRNFFG
eukprot:c11099_g1_i1.p1 GENE.c11099_g1_i1~~c11099_g1_i1.p1  ORF type:complete len:298 (+),score=78.08 c11099_g1_i1:100-993(+)